jgi:two-component system, sensor histidine kinase and response regulator
VTTLAEPGLLIVDDIPENLLAVEAALEPLGHRCIRATSGEEALKHLLVDDIAVIVLDVQMPGMDGFETALAIKQRERSRDIPIVFLTAMNREDEHRLRGYETGAVDYLFKPVAPELLRAKVSVFLELHLKTRLLVDQGRSLARRTAELERSNADLEQFSYVASHDLQEPLRVVSGYLELLAESAADRVTEEERGWIDRCTSATARMSGMIDDLLTYARAGSSGGEPATVDLDAALAVATESVGRSLLDAGGRIDASPLGKAWAVPGDVERVLQNLLANAVKYRGDGPPVIQVTATQLDGHVEVAVCDRGVGVDEADLERVFGRFERIGGQPAPGTGLGLAVCRRLVERSGGRIRMERNEPGPGVTVRFTVPAAR